MERRPAFSVGGSGCVFPGELAEVLLRLERGCDVPGLDPGRDWENALRNEGPL